MVNAGDFDRAMTEFWADGPKSETPPGHWNVIANTVSDELAPNLRIGGTGPPVDRLQWDVKLYLALNGAVHDAAIAAWGLKGDYDSVAADLDDPLHGRASGQSSDPGAARRTTPEGLPLVPGPDRADHARRRPRQGSATRHSQATRARSRSAPGRGNPKDPKTQTSGVGWILAVELGARTSCRRS